MINRHELSHHLHSHMDLHINIQQITILQEIQDGKSHRHRTSHRLWLVKELLRRGNWFYLEMEISWFCILLGLNFQHRELFFIGINIKEKSVVEVWRNKGCSWTEFLALLPCDLETFLFQGRLLKAQKLPHSWKKNGKKIKIISINRFYF